MHAAQALKRSVAGVELVRLLAEQGDRVFSTSRARELSARAGVKAPYLCEALHHLRRNGWIVALRRGLYALASALPGVPPVHEFEVAMALARRAAISHWSALHYHGLTEQPPRTVFVLATTNAPRLCARDRKPSGAGAHRVLGATTYRLIRVRPKRFFGTEEVWMGDARVTITDPERTLLDGLMMPQHCGDFAEVLHAFQTRGERLNLRRIMAYAHRLGAVAVKRLGWVLEHQGVDPARLSPLLSAPIKGYRRLDPTGPRRGPFCRRWMIQENLPGTGKP